jgi:hypothetical protein
MKRNTAKRQAKNHVKLMEGLQLPDELCVRQFVADYNIDAVHLVSVYNAIVTAVAMWDRDKAAPVVAEIDFGGQEVTDADRIEDEVVERRRIAYIRIWTELRAAGHELRPPFSQPTAQQK